MEISLKLDKEKGHRMIRTIKPCCESGCNNMSARECYHCDKHCQFILDCMNELERSEKNIRALFPNVQYFKILGVDLVMVIFTDESMITIVPQMLDEITSLLPKGFKPFSINAFYNEVEDVLTGKKELSLSLAWRKN